MSKFPILLGVGLACALGGAIAGNAVGSIPVTDRSTVEMFYQAHKTATVGQYGQRLLPDHYPLVTRDGVVEVARLSDRGLFRQARYRPSNLAAGYAASADEGDPGVAFVEEYSPDSRSAAATAAAPAETVSLAQGPSRVSGHAKIIDVQATLAMR